MVIRPEAECVPPLGGKSPFDLRKEICRQVNGIALVLSYGAILTIGGIMIAFVYPFVRYYHARDEAGTNRQKLPTH